MLQLIQKHHALWFWKPSNPGAFNWSLGRALSAEAYTDVAGVALATEEDIFGVFSPLYSAVERGRAVVVRGCDAKTAEFLSEFASQSAIEFCDEVVERHGAFRLIVVSEHKNAKEFRAANKIKKSPFLGAFRQVRGGS